MLQAIQNAQNFASEEFGDGIMSAIDFDMIMDRQADPKGDRVKLTMTGKVAAVQG